MACFQQMQIGENTIYLAAIEFYYLTGTNLQSSDWQLDGPKCFRQCFQKPV